MKYFYIVYAELSISVGSFFKLLLRIRDFGTLQMFGRLCLIVNIQVQKCMHSIPTFYVEYDKTYRTVIADIYCFILFYRHFV
jgi:hypothetical protein